MLESIHIENLRSIADLIVPLTFAQGKAPNGYRNLPTIPFFQVGNQKNDRLCPVLALYGANAAGKTSVLLAMVDLIQTVTNGFSPLRYTPNRTLDTENKPTTIEITFWIQNQRLEYVVAYDREGITFERLIDSGKIVFSAQKDAPLKLGKALKPSTRSICDLYRKHCINVGTGAIVKTFLHEMSQALPGLSLELLAAYDYLTKNIFVFLTTDMPFQNGIRALAGTYTNLSEEEAEGVALSEIAQYLSRLDTQILDLRMRKTEAGIFIKQLPPELLATLPKGSFDKYAYSLQTVHKTISGKAMHLDIMEESEGSKKLVGLLGYLLAALKVGKVVLVDELDRSLHGLLVRQIVTLFKDKDENRKNAQILFTTHNTDLLDFDLLGVSEVGILNLRGTKGTKLMRLAEHKGLRNCNDFRRRYLRGDFGGIPFPHF